MRIYSQGESPGRKHKQLVVRYVPVVSGPDGSAVKAEKHLNMREDQEDVIIDTDKRDE